MAVTYNKVNWDEDTLVDAPLLDNMDVGIDEVVTQSNSNKDRITTNESKLDTIQGSETEVDGRITNNENDISNLVKFEIVEEGTTEIEGNDSVTITIDEVVPIYPLLYVEFDSIDSDDQNATLDVQYVTNTFLHPEGNIRERFRIKLTNSSSNKVIVDYKMVKII